MSQDSEKEVYTVVQDMPVFPGGDDALRNFIEENLQPPAEATEKRIHGAAIVSFIVRHDGKLDDIKPVSMLGGGLEEEAVRIVRAMPNWEPGRHQGNAVDVEFRLPIWF